MVTNSLCRSIMAFNISKYVSLSNSLKLFQNKVTITQNVFNSYFSKISSVPLYNYNLSSGVKNRVRLSTLYDLGISLSVNHCYRLYQTTTSVIDDDSDTDEEIEERDSRKVQEQMLVSFIERSKSVTTSDWEEFRDKVLTSSGFVNKVNIDGIIMGLCINSRRFNVGSSYLDYITSTGNGVNVATLSRFLKLCYVCHFDSVSESLKERILSVYTKLRSLSPVMDANTAENVIHGLVLTQNWKEGLEILSEINLTCTPSASTYSVLVKAAFDNDEIDIGWKLMDEMLLKGRKPMPFAYIAWLNLCLRLDNNHGSKDMVKLLLTYFVTNDLRPTKEVADEIRSCFKKSDVKWKGHFTSLTESGRCKSCKNVLDPVKITGEEFISLRTNFFNQVVVGRNVFTKTTPKELQNFQQFVDSTAPYDVVIDGLNVAYSAGTSKNKRSSPQASKLLQSVVQHFVNQSQKVLVVGRKHMLSWPRRNMDYIHSNAEVFLAENLSQDDPFLLYATMHSGLGTYFISRDLMRSHAFLLKDPALKMVFKCWQQQYQYQVIYIADDGDINLKPPLTFNPSVQCSSSGAWHIPYDMEFIANPPQTFVAPVHWLCLCPTPVTKTVQ